ncbi:battenin [Scleropages formosus]|uniref:Battenin n=1 Tax=Scleropages formosus TaxID=113540 RepID=A0A8C9R3P3_SCLFO|nr:battenin [Scleropages formosus]
MERAQTSLNSDPEPRGRWSFWRNLSGFWLLGLCNNFAYVVMLSAAHDILHQQESHNSTSPRPLGGGGGGGGGGNGSNGNSSLYDCNPVSTAAVLLADILPTLVIKAVAPFFIHKFPYGCRVLTCVATATASFLLVSFSSTVGMSILGVIFASMSSGLGELSFLSLTVFFDGSVLGGWGSGTGGAGVIGAFLYSAFTQAGLSPRTTLLIMLVVPVVMTISYYFLLVFPPAFSQWQCMEEGPVRNNQERRPLMEEEEEKEAAEDEEKPDERFLEPLTFPDKVTVIRGLVKFIVPLGLVYFAEYFINQGLLELLFFPASFLSHAEQYRWYQTLYQIGVFVSRSSLFCVKIRRVWIMSVLQCVNAVLLCVAVQFHFLPNVFTVFVIIFYEGLLGGAAYINTFHFISKETGAREREFAMAAASVGDSLGIALSSPLSFFVHNYFCSR